MVCRAAVDHELIVPHVYSSAARQTTARPDRSERFGGRVRLGRSADGIAIVRGHGYDNGRRRRSEEAADMAATTATTAGVLPCTVDLSDRVASSSRCGATAVSRPEPTVTSPAGVREAFELKREPDGSPPGSAVDRVSPDLVRSPPSRECAHRRKRRRRVTPGSTPPDSSATDAVQPSRQAQLKVTAAQNEADAARVRWRRA